MCVQLAAHFGQVGVRRSGKGINRKMDRSVEKSGMGVCERGRAPVRKHGKSYADDQAQTLKGKENEEKKRSALMNRKLKERKVL